MKKIKNIITTILIFTLMSMSAFAAIQDFGSYSTHGVSGYNSLAGYTNINELEETISIPNPDISETIICDPFGDITEPVNNYLVVPVSNQIKIYGYDNTSGEIQNIKSYEVLDSSFIISRIACHEPMKDSNRKDNSYKENIIIVATNSTNTSTYDLSFSDIDTFSLNNQNIFPITDSNPLTSLDCSYYIESGNEEYFCSYGSTSDKIITFGSQDNDHILSISGIDLENSQTYIDTIPETIVSSYGSTYEVIFVNQTTMSQSLEVKSDSVVFADIDSCSSQECSPTYTTYTNSFTSSGSRRYNIIEGITGIRNSFTYGESDKKYSKDIFISNIEVSYSNRDYYMSLIKLNDGVENYKKTIDSDTNFPSLKDNNPILYRNNLKMIISEINGVGDLDICSNIYLGDLDSQMIDTTTTTWSSIENIFCYDISSGSQSYLNQITSNNIENAIETQEQNTISGMGLFAGINYYYLSYYDLDNSIYNFETYDGIGSFNYINLTSEPSRILLSDLNLDGTQELFFYGEDSSYIKYKKVESESAVTINPLIAYDGLYGFYEPAKNGSIQNFTATECNSEDGTECSFYNPSGTALTSYKLCSNCSGTTSYSCSLFNYNSPSKSCQFNNTGFYDITFDLYTSTNPSTIAGKFYINDYEVTETGSNNLIESIDPELDSEGVTGGTSQEATTEEIAGFLGVLQNNIKPIVGFIIVIGLVSTLAAEGVRNPIVLMMAGIFGLVIVSLLGLISSEILILTIAVLIALVVIDRVVLKSKSDND